MMTMEDLQAKMMRWSIACPKACEKALRQAAYLVQNSAQQDFMGGKGRDPTHQHLYVQSGTLRRSITQRVEVSQGSISARVGTNLEYAAIHEFGGSINVGTRGQMALRGKFVSTKEAMKKKNKPGVTMTFLGAHTVNMPERPYLRPALWLKRPRIFKMLEEAAFSSYA